MTRCLPRGTTPRNAPTAVMLAIACVVLAGCVSLPTSGSPGAVNPLPNSERSQILITPRAPGPGWSAQDIVGGFLTASGADRPMAKDYLTRRYAKVWHPSQLPWVIDTGYKVSNSSPVSPVPPRLTGGQSQVAQVTVTSEHLEDFVPAGTSEAGRLQVSPASAPYTFNFHLVQVGGQWQISSITGLNGKRSTSIWLITQADFQRNYQARNLYYRSTVSPESLVPDPVYLPVTLGQIGSVTALVEAVSSVPPTKSNWLYNAVTTAFPRKSKIIGIQVHANQAVVTLGGAAATVDPPTLGQMEAQLVWTLTYAPDSAGTGIGFIHLQVGSRSMDLYPANFMNWIQRGPGWPVFYQTLDSNENPALWSYQPGVRSQATGAGRTGTAKKRGPLIPGTAPVGLPTGLGRGFFTAIAISPASAGSPVDTFAGCRGRTIYEASLLLNAAELLQRSLPASCTSLSWANPYDLWVTAGSDVYVVNQNMGTLLVTPVVIPDQQVIGSGDFVSLKVAPDGVRVAMIVRTKHSASVYISAITKQKNSPQNSPLIYLAQGGPVLTVGPGLVNPISLSWWDSDHLLVLCRSGNISQLYLVPLTGGSSSKVPTPANAVSVTANGSVVAVGTLGSAEQGQSTVQISQQVDGAWEVWTPVAPGSTPKSTPTYTGL